RARLREEKRAGLYGGERAAQPENTGAGSEQSNPRTPYRRRDAQPGDISMRFTRLATVSILGSAAACFTLAARPQAKQVPAPEEKAAHTVEVKVGRVLHNDATGIGAGKDI